MGNIGRGGLRIGAGRTPIEETKRKRGYQIYMTQPLYNDINEYGLGSSFSEKVSELLSIEIRKRKASQNRLVRFIDLFAGLGGIRLGFEQAFSWSNIFK